MDDKKKPRTGIVRSKPMTEHSRDFLSDMVEEVRTRAKGAGRKTKRTPQLIEEILILLRAGIPLEVACNSNDVTSDCVYNWRKADPDLDALIKTAMTDGLEMWESKMLSITSGGKGSTGIVDRDKLLVDTMKWIMARRNPLYRENKNVTVDTTQFTFVTDGRVANLLSAPPQMIDGEFVEVEALPNPSDDV